MTRSFRLLLFAFVLLFIAPRASRAQTRADSAAALHPQIGLVCQPEPVSFVSVLQYTIRKAATVNIQVYDNTGRVVATLENHRRPAGLYQVMFDRQSLPNGVYYCQITAGETALSRRIELVKQ